MDELDRILSEEQHIHPPIGFEQRVMSAVMGVASAPPPIPFPWRYAVAAIATMVTAVIACSLLWPAASASPFASTGAQLQRAMASVDPSVLAWSSSICAALIGMLRYSARLVTS